MGTLYLVRHGQASFGADDYDVLSPLGRQQSVRLGAYFQYRGVRFEAALTGTLNRQLQTFAAICEGMDSALESSRSAGPPQASPTLSDPAVQQSPHNPGTLPKDTNGRSAGPPQARPAPSGGSALHEVKSVGAHLLWPGLNEYDSAAVIGAIYPQPLARPDTPELYRHHFRLLKDGLAQWMAGAASPQGMPSYHDFVAGVTSALEHIRTRYTGNVLLVSSGGPIATAVGQVLGTTAQTTIGLNMRIRNTSVTEFSFSPRRHQLLTYNTLPHLDAPEHASWVTYA
ncbi:MAG: Phosphoglycerate mutase [Polaromonas sp.]|nr:Phosphoglycerate mutase [Polaromonas sp.]